MTDQRLFPGQSQPASRGPAGDDQGARVNRLLAKIHCEGPLAEVNADYVAQLILRAKASRLLAHVLNQLGALNTLGKSGEIFYQSSERELASGLVSFNHQRLEVGASRVERRGVTGAARPDDDDVANVFHKGKKVACKSGPLGPHSAARRPSAFRPSGATGAEARHL